MPSASGVPSTSVQLPYIDTSTNNSSYTLHTVIYNDDEPLLTPNTPSYGTAVAGNSPTTPSATSSRRLVVNACLKMAAVFVISTALLGGILWLALPTLEEADRPMLRVPKSFEQLQDLNTLLKKYRDIYPFRILVCYVVTYLFLQAFSLPGSMYLSILGGAVWGVARALPLACACVATGASLCYLISAALGPALLAIPRFRNALNKWSSKLESQKENLIPFLIVLRIAPLPPHWVVNVVCPHVGIGLIPFWISTFLGIVGVTVIHTTIGGGLDQMTSADDFHLISWRNFFGLSAIVVGVLIPVGLRYYFKAEVANAADDSQQLEEEEEDIILESGPLLPHKDDEEEGEFYEDDDDDVILESGPALVQNNNKSSGIAERQEATTGRRDIIDL